MLTVGEHVFLSTVNLGNAHFATTVQKLRPAYDGPFKITEKLSPYTYRLELPKRLRSIHPVFHVALLWRAVPTPVDMEARLGTGVVFPGPEPVHPEEGTELLTHDDEGVAVYVMERVVARKTSGSGFRYLVKWQGYPVEESSWVTKSEMVTTAALRLLTDYDKRYPKQTKLPKPKFSDA